jgi:large conductance mechanosensitive channel
MLKGFKDFLLRGNVVDLAVAVIIGAAFNSVVTALVKDIITPFIGVFGGEPDFSGWHFTINNSKFMVGDFVNQIVSFVIVSAVIYFAIVLPMNKIKAKLEKNKNPAEPVEKTCPECLSSIPAKAKRCKYCTAVLTK